MQLIETDKTIRIGLEWAVNRDGMKETARKLGVSQFYITRILQRKAPVNSNLAQKLNVKIWLEKGMNVDAMFRYIWTELRIFLG